MSIEQDQDCAGAAEPPALPAAAKADAVRWAVIIGFALYLTLAALAWWLGKPLLPERVSFSLLGHGVSIGELHRRIATTLAMVALVVPGIFLTEIVLGGWSGSSLRHLLVDRTRSSMVDLVCFLGGQGRVVTLAAVVFSFGASLITGVWLHDRLREATGLSLSLTFAPWPFQMLLYFLIYTFFDYWNHRISHSRYFWPLHRYHHGAEEFCVLTSTRTHPAVFTDVVAIALPAGLLELSPEVILQVNIFVIVMRFVIHSRINSDFGWVGRYLLQSPLHHRRHHKLDMTDPTCNFALIPLWDRLFGTWGAEADPNMVIGVVTPYRHSAWLLPDWWRDYCDFWKGLGLRLRGNTAELNAWFGE